MGGMQNFVEERREEGREDEASLSDYLQDVALLTDLDSKGDDDEPRVSLMTIHASKGLEFSTVFVVGLEENIFPSPIASNTLRELEEERRLLYVAITRAEKHCVLTSAKNRFRYGKIEFGNPSRFLNEIDPKLIKEDSEMAHDDFSFNSGGYGGRMPWDRTSVSSQFKPDRKSLFSDKEDRDNFRASGNMNRGGSDDFRSATNPVHQESRFKSFRGVEAARRVLASSSPSSPSSTSSSASASVSTGLSVQLVEGSKIEHQRFGIGTVLKLEGTGENAKATVKFVNSGTKQLLLKFAKFSVLG